MSSTAAPVEAKPPSLFAAFRRALAGALGWQQFGMPLLLFSLNAFLVYAFFFPNLSDINAWDEAGYIVSGRALLAGQWPSVSASPLVSILYALTYLPYRSSPFWLIQSCTLGRIVLFTLLWVSAALIARQLRSFTSPALMLGILFVTPLSLEMLRFPSDPLYAAMAGLALWQLLRFRATGRLRHAWAASVFVALSAFSRNDGLLLFFVVLVMAFALSPAGRRWQALLASAVPFLILVGGWVVLTGLRTGSFSLGTMGRTYDNFESGQQAVFGGTGDQNAVIEARAEARRLFGTPQENHYSVLAAIRRNPSEYMRRLIATVKGLPDTFLHAFGIRFAPLLLLLGLRGAVELVRRKHVWLLVLMLSFAAPILSGFVITLVRPGHMQLWYYVVFALAAVGLAAALAGLTHAAERAAWSGVLGAIAVYGLVANKLAIFYGAAVLLVALWVCYLAVSRFPFQPASVAMPLVLLIAGVVLRGNFPSPTIRTLGVAADEQAVVYMQEHLPPGTLVAAGAPGVVQTAGMVPATLSALDVPVGRSQEGFLRWMRDQGIRAVYVDYSLSSDNPAIWRLIEPQIGNGFERVFTADQGDIQVLLVQPAP